MDYYNHMKDEDPYLIQRMERNKSITDSPKDHRFGEVFRLEYMGSAEFEFGSVPAFIRRMQACELKGFKCKIDGNMYFGVYNPNTWSSDEAVIDMLKKVAGKKIRLKEDANFPPRVSRWSKTAAWAAIDRDVFWTKEGLGVDTIKCLFDNSVEYMDERNSR